MRWNDFEHAPSAWRRQYTPPMAREPDDILARVLAAYANCRSYRDEGVVTTVFYSPRKRTDRHPFSTRFVRPDGFCFEFRDRAGEDEWDQYAIWLEAGVSRSWWSVDPDGEEPESLSTAIAGATGVSGGSAFRVPHLLMPGLYESEDGCQRPPVRGTLMDTPDANALNCVVIACSGGICDGEQLWIDRSTWLIRRVVEPRRKLELPGVEEIESVRTFDPELADRMLQDLKRMAARDPIEVETITTYEPELDAKIASEELRFSPPQE